MASATATGSVTCARCSWPGSRNGTFETRLIIDPVSGDPLSRETPAVQPDGASELAHYGLVVDTGYTDD